MTGETDTRRAGEPVSRREIQRLWSRWAGAVVRVREAKGSAQSISRETYQRNHRALREACGAAGARANSEEAGLFREMIAVLDPWSDLRSFQNADAAILADLEARLALVQRKIGGRFPRRRTGRFRKSAKYLGLGGIIAGLWFIANANPSAGDSWSHFWVAVRYGLYRAFYQGTFVLRGASVVEWSAMIVALAVAVGLYTAMRTRSY